MTEKPTIAIESRRTGWFWRFEYVKGYGPWAGPYRTEQEAMRSAREARRAVTERTGNKQ